MSFAEFFRQGDAVTQVVALLLLAMSVSSWVVILWKAWLLHRAPNVLLIPGTADPAHLEANMAVGEISFDDDARAALDAVESRSNDVRIGRERA